MTRRVWAGLTVIVAAVLALTWIAWPSPPKAVTLYCGTEHYTVTVTVDSPRAGRPRWNSPSMRGRITTSPDPNR
ncbi:Hypothetical protein ERS075658_01058 [Mycobacteroides abscessus]|nr:Hypothetical protein ERS075658_01058 [Mycobacteroides abscessus]